MATLNSFTPSMTFLLYSSSLLLVLFSCVPEKIQSLASRSHSADCDRYNGTFRNLTLLRDLLVGQEDTIVSCLIERSKYPLNSQLYAKNTNPHGSLLDSFINESEAVQSKAGRYLSEAENMFSNKYSQVPHLNCPVLYPAGACININDRILNYYVTTLLPKVAAKGGDDSWNYVSTEATDLTCLQALSWRIHLGKFVAEAKYNASYDPLIKAKNAGALRELLTVKKIEDEIIARVGKKAQIFGQDVNVNGSSNSKQFKVEPAVVSQMYTDVVIPYTKDVEVAYLLRRLNKKSQCSKA